MYKAYFYVPQREVVHLSITDDFKLVVGELSSSYIPFVVTTEVGQQYFNVKKGDEDFEKFEVPPEVD